MCREPSSKFTPRWIWSICWSVRKARWEDRKHRPGAVPRRDKCVWRRQDYQRAVGSDEASLPYRRNRQRIFLTAKQQSGSPRPMSGHESANDKIWSGWRTIRFDLARLTSPQDWKAGSAPLAGPTTACFILAEVKTGKRPRANFQTAQTISVSSQHQCIIRITTVSAP